VLSLTKRARQMNIREKKQTQDLNEKLATLTHKERKYFSIMRAKYGVLFITSKPGIAKSAIAKSIADKMGYNYIDMRLTMNDESDFKYPFIEEMEYGGKTIKVSGYAVPSWAYKANSAPTIIHFEELNRAPLFVRNAALQILLEREIGDFKFNDNVLMMASGNLGEEDGTDVEELDSALNNRLIHVDHTLTTDEWLEEFGNKNCHKIITSFIKAYPETLQQRPNENSKAYTTPRTWTMLSEFIVKNFGMESKPEEFMPMLREVAFSYIGNTSVRFLQYCDDMNNLSIDDIVNRFSKVKDKVMEANRSKKSELVQSLREYDLNKMSSKQMDNIVSFLKLVSDEEKAAYLLFVVMDNDDYDIEDEKIRNFMSNFQDILLSIFKINEEREDI
jgi:hypothetical protein